MTVEHLLAGGGTMFQRAPDLSRNDPGRVEVVHAYAGKAAWSIAALRSKR